MITSPGLITAAVLAVAAAPLPASDLDGALMEAADAEYVGRQLVVTFADDDVIADVYTVSQSDGMTMVENNGRAAMAGHGVLLGQHESRYNYVEIPVGLPWRLGDRYRVADEVAITQFGRSAHRIDVTESDQLRARFVFDDATSASLSAEVYAGDGSLYRFASLFEFSPGVTGAMLDEGDMPSPEVMVAADSVTLPPEAGGYWRADSWEAEGPGVQVFYTDGLFKFSVFELSRKVDPQELGELPKVEYQGTRGYHQRHTPSAVWLFWRAPNHSYLLVGDLPPDHLENVVADLPEPGRANPFVRAWRWLFG